MKKNNFSKIGVKPLLTIALMFASKAANSRCAFIYHQPKQPLNLTKLRKF